MISLFCCFFICVLVYLTINVVPCFCRYLFIYFVMSLIHSLTLSLLVSFFRYFVRSVFISSLGEACSVSVPSQGSSEFAQALECDPALL